jgi:hypothetical protein
LAHGLLLLEEFTQALVEVVSQYVFTLGLVKVNTPYNPKE